MRKIPRMLIFCLSAAMILSLSSCKEEAKTELTPFELYQQAYEKLQAQDSVEYAVEAYLDMSGAVLEAALGDSMDAVSLMIDGNVKQAKVSEAAYDVAVDMNIEVPFTDLSAAMQMYHTDGYLYIGLPDFDMAYKMAIPVSEDNAALTAMGTMGAEPITEDMLKDSALSSDGDTISLTLDGSKLNEQMASQNVTSGEVQPVSVTVEDIPMTIKLDENGDITSYTTRMDMQVTDGDISIDVKLDATVDIVATGNVTISFPDDLGSYTELDMMAMLGTPSI